MKTASLLKRAPTLVMVAFLAYACYSIHASLLDPLAGRADLSKGLEFMVKDVLQESAEEVQSLTRVMRRDPFQVAQKVADAPKAPKEESLNDDDAASLAAIVSGLSLDATFLQGQTRIAIISRRMYHQGQHLIFQGDTGKSYSPLLLEDVQAHKVTLSARGKTYVLGYPAQLGNRTSKNDARGRGPAGGAMAEIDPEGELAFYKRLLNSPLGKMGKSLTGITGPGQGARRSRSPRAGGPGGSAGGSSP
jgi:hypothetical protein